ncbi:MAG: oxygenase MpaB family protein [Acidimicrobiales bacterium]
MYQELGPDSLLWRWAGDSRIALIGGTIGLLQLMHPAIGAGVLEHSDFFADPYDRVFRSLPWILGVVYDEDGEATGHTVRDFHRSIKGVDTDGRRYHALDPETFWWAHATFQFMAEQVADRFDTHRVTSGEREQLYQEGVEWYRRYGVSMRPVPADREAFAEKWDRMCSETLEMNPAVEFVLETLARPRAPRSLPAPLHRVQPLLRIRAVRQLAFVPIRITVIGGLPPIVRERFGITLSRADQAALDAIEAAVRNTWHLLPASQRWQPRALSAWRRVGAHAA